MTMLPFNAKCTDVLFYSMIACVQHLLHLWKKRTTWLLKLTFFHKVKLAANDWTEILYPGNIFWDKHTSGPLGGRGDVSMHACILHVWWIVILTLSVSYPPSHSLQTKQKTTWICYEILIKFACTVYIYFLKWYAYTHIHTYMYKQLER